MDAPVPTIAALVEERQRLKSWLEQAQAKFDEGCKPTRERMAVLDAQCQAMMIAQGVKSQRTDHGTAILSESRLIKLTTDKTTFLDWCLDNWEKYGQQMLQIGAPQVGAVREYMDDHNGQLPPNMEMSTYLSFRIRKA